MSDSQRLKELNPPQIPEGILQARIAIGLPLEGKYRAHLYRNHRWRGERELFLPLLFLKYNDLDLIGKNYPMHLTESQLWQEADSLLGELQKLMHPLQLVREDLLLFPHLMLG
jgi:hypothetical protein